MSYQKERDEFIAAIVAEFAAKGWDSRDAVDLARLVLRNATTIQRCEERVCSDEAADRDRVLCPAIKGTEKDCCCGKYKWTVHRGHRVLAICETEDLAKETAKEIGGLARYSNHGMTPRVQFDIRRATQRIEKACEPWGIKPLFHGGPRGACVTLILPSGRSNSFGGPEYGFCVPTR